MHHFFLPYSNIILTEKEHRMLEDDDFWNVTESDILSLLRRMPRGKFPTEDRIYIREKYDGLFADRESEFIHELGIHSYQDIRIDKCASCIYINGYTAFEWKMVNDYPDFHPSLSSIRSAIKRLGQLGNEDAVDIIIEKYGRPLSVRQIDSYSFASPHEAAQYPNYCRIDGLTANHWRALHDDTYLPGKAYINFLITKAVAAGDVDEESFLKTKYADLLQFDDVRILAHEEAIIVFESIFGRDFYKYFKNNPYVQTDIGEPDSLPDPFE